MRISSILRLSPLILASACLLDSSSPDLGSCAEDAQPGQSYGEIGIGTCLAGPVDMEFFEADGTTWLAVANANPNENFSTGSVVVIDWASIDTSVRRNQMGDLTAHATATDAPVSYTHLTLPTNREV